MADEVETTALDSASEPSADSSGSTSATEAVAAPESAPAEKAAVDPETEFWARLEKIDPDELLTKAPGLKRRVDGKTGEIADRLARQRAEQMVAQWQTEERARQEAEIRRKLREEDPYKFAEWDREREEKEQRQRSGWESEIAMRQAYLSGFDAEFNKIFAELPDPIQAKLSAKQYDGTPESARVQFIREVLSEAREHAVKDYEKKTLPTLKEAIRKEILAELNGAEPSPDVDGGASGGGAITWTVFQANKHDPDWIRRNYDKVNDLVARRARG